MLILSLEKSRCLFGEMFYSYVGVDLYFFQEGCTPLYWAARSNYMAILRALVRAGAKVNYRVKVSSKQILKMKQLKSLPRVSNKVD